jgi:hypothetical protein
MSSPRSSLSLKDRMDRVLNGFVSDHRGFFGVLKREGKDRAQKYLVDLNRIADEGGLIRKVYFDILQDEGVGCLNSSQELRSRLALELLSFVRDKTLSSFENGVVNQGLDGYLNTYLVNMLQGRPAPKFHDVLKELSKFIRIGNDSSVSYEQGMPNAYLLERKTLKEILVEYLDHYILTNDGALKKEGRQRAEDYKQFIAQSELTDYEFSRAVFNDVFEEKGAGRLQSSSIMRISLMNALCEYAGLRKDVADKADRLSMDAAKAAVYGGGVPAMRYLRQQALEMVLRGRFEQRASFRP